MKIKLLHLYPEAMSLYGEYANLTLLSRLLRQMGAEVEPTALTGTETPDFSDADLIYMGCGTERTQKWVLSALRPHAQALRSAADRGALIFFTGNAMETLGASVTDREGTVHKGLGLAAFTTVETDRRTPHDAIAQTDLWDAPTVGFMNKCSATSGIVTPLFPAMAMGFGNDAQKGPEGYLYGSVIATHLTGPVLAKNPAFLRYVTERLYAAKGESMPDLPTGQPWLLHAAQAYNVTLSQLTGRANG